MQWKNFKEMQIKIEVGLNPEINITIITKLKMKIKNSINKINKSLSSVTEGCRQGKDYQKINIYIPLGLKLITMGSLEGSKND